MKSLIESWEKLADKYTDMGRAAMNLYTKERLFATSETYSICADQLKRRIKQVYSEKSKCTCHPHDLVYYGCRCKTERG